MLRTPSSPHPPLRTAIATYPSQAPEGPPGGAGSPRGTRLARTALPDDHRGGLAARLSGSPRRRVAAGCGAAAAATAATGGAVAGMSRGYRRDVAVAVPSRGARPAAQRPPPRPRRVISAARAAHWARAPRPPP